MLLSIDNAHHDSLCYPTEAMIDRMRVKEACCRMPSATDGQDCHSKRYRANDLLIYTNTIEPSGNHSLNKQMDTLCFLIWPKMRVPTASTIMGKRIHNIDGASRPFIYETSKSETHNQPRIYSSSIPACLRIVEIAAKPFSTPACE
jgi:hypothetical protein